MSVEGTAICSKCKTEKSITEFSKDKNSAVGRTYQCKACRREVHKGWRAANPERIKELNEHHKETRKSYYSDPEVKLKYRKRMIEKSFGISYSEYEAMYKSQGGKCAICSGEESCARNEHLAIDHCHESGRIRGLLCSTCNRALGLFKDSIDVLEGAKQYLLNYKEIKL